MYRGFVKLYRKIEDSGLMQNHKAFTLFMHLLMRASHKERKTGVPSGDIITLKRGQLVTGRKQLARDLKMSEQNVRTAMALLIGLEILTSEPTNAYSVITVLNYDKYQADLSSQPADQPPGNHRVTTTQELKTEKKLKHPQFDLFWVLCPKKVGKGYAEKAWEKLNGFEKGLAIEAMGKHAAHWKVTGVKTAFIPHPSSWLGGRRWEDEFEKPSTSVF